MGIPFQTETLRGGWWRSAWPGGGWRLVLFSVTHEQLRHEKAPSLLQFHSEPQKGSSLLVHNVNLAPIKASVGTSVDNRKSLFIKKHPVVGPGVYDPSCRAEAQRHIRARIFKIPVYWTKLPYPQDKQLWYKVCMYMSCQRGFCVRPSDSCLFFKVSSGMYCLT